MPIAQTARARILSSIISQFNEVALIDNTASVQVGNTFASVSNVLIPSRIPLTWSSISVIGNGSYVSITNTAISNPLTWTVGQNKVLSKLLLISPSTLIVVGIINVPTPVPTYTNQGAYHTRSLGLTLGESV